ncbi:MAG: OsmC family protein [Algicola sp.]|nr:OsmC family protein [Algicola sp.]
MSTYFAEIKWQREQQNFLDDQYSRGHTWRFDGGVTVPASSSPHIVPVPMSVEANVDPEEAFVASLSSCHMLFFLSIAAKRRYVVDSYVDKAEGLMENDKDGDMAMTKVTLKPEVKFSGDRMPKPAQIDKMHHQAHDLCFLAKSVKSEIVVEALV